MPIRLRVMDGGKGIDGACGGSPVTVIAKEPGRVSVPKSVAGGNGAVVPICEAPKFATPVPNVTVGRTQHAFATSVDGRVVGTTIR